MKILVVGSTGMVGGETARRLAGAGRKVRGLIRPTSDEKKVKVLEREGVEVIVGDLREPKSLEAACRGVETVITTVSAMPFSWQEGNTIGGVDRDGAISLVDAAKAAGVQRFIYLSFPHGPEPGFALGDAKVAVENHLTSSGMEYAILWANFFMEVWLSPAFGFDYTSNSATIYGDGSNGITWVSVTDVARALVEAVTSSIAKNKVLPVGGPELLTPLEVLKIFEEASGKKWNVQHVAVDALQKQLAAAGDEVQASVAALQLAYATADFSMDPSSYLVPRYLKSVRQYAAEVLKQYAHV